MKGKIIGIVAILVVVTLVFAGIWVLLIGSSNPIVSDFDDEETGENVGSWGQEVYVEFENGAVESLNFILAHKQLSVSKFDKKVVAITYVLRMKASGTGHDTVTADFSDYSVDIQTRGEGGSPVHQTVNIQDTDNESVSKPLDGEWYVIQSIRKTIDTYFPSSLEPGIYEINFVPKGGIMYKGNLDLDYSVATLPNNLYSSDWDVSADGSISLEWSSSISY